MWIVDESYFRHQYDLMFLVVKLKEEAIIVNISPVIDNKF